MLATMLPLERILVAIDLGPTSASVLSHACDMACIAGASIAVLHVYATDEPEGAPPPDPDPRREAAAAALRALVASVGREQAAELVLVPRTQAEAALVTETAQRISAGMIVIGTHGRSGLTRMLLGSVAEQILRRSTCPVLVVPTHG